MELSSLIIEQFSAAITAYFSNLNWAYIISLILLSEVVNRIFPDKLYSVFGLRVRFSKRYRVPVLGLVLAVVFFYIGDGQTKADVRIMIQSMVAAMVFHLWFLDKLIQKYLPNNEKSDEA